MNPLKNLTDDEVVEMSVHPERYLEGADGFFHRTPIDVPTHNSDGEDTEAK